MRGPMNVKTMNVKKKRVLEQTFLCPIPHYVYEFKVSKNDFEKKKCGGMEIRDKLPNVRLLWVPIYGLYCVCVDIYIYIYFFFLFDCAFEVRDWLTELVG